MSAPHATLYTVALLTANTVTAFGVYLTTGPPIALLIGVVTLLLFAGIIESRWERGKSGILETLI